MGRFSIIGFGKIGQAVAARIIQSGLPLSAVDINEALPLSFNNGNFATQEPGVGNILHQAYRQGILSLSSNFSCIRDCDTAIVCIPLLVDDHKEINEKPFLECFERIAPHLHGGCLLSVETSVPVGFCRQKIVPLLAEGGKTHGKDFYLVHSPERIKSGTMLQQLNQNPKVIGGIDQQATMKGIEVYSQFLDRQLLVTVSNIETAEMIKLAGMAYRDINIALANQLAAYCHKTDIDVTEVIRYANTDNEAFLLNPGIGVGGHCTPVYPYFLIRNFEEAGLDFTLAREGRQINDEMARFAAKMADGISPRRALILGLGFRPDVREDIFSTTYRLKPELERRGFEVFLHDPLYTTAELRAKGFTPAEGIYETRSSVVFLITSHSDYLKLDWKRLKESGCEKFIDGRNFFDPETVKEAGIKYTGIGRPA